MSGRLPKASDVPEGARSRTAGAVLIGQAFGASFLTLSASLANFLVHQGYPLLRIDVAATFGILAGVCLLGTLIYGLMPRPFRSLMEAALIILLVDINFTGAGTAFVIGIIVLIGLVFFQKSLTGLLTVFGAIVLATTVVGIGSASEWMHTVSRKSATTPIPANANRPAIIHFLMDEHLGFGGFPKDAAGQKAAAGLRDFYVGHGFRIYPRAYSRHMHTVNAIPDLLNFGDGRRASSDNSHLEVGPTRYFQRLNTLGYSLSIYQSEFGEFCSGATHARCFEYDSSSLVPLIGYTFTTKERVMLIMAKFVSLAQSLAIPENLYIRHFVQQTGTGTNPFPPPSFTNKSSSVATLRFFDRVETDLAATKPGQAIFVHALYPHYPYASEADCRIKPLSNWRHRLDWTSLSARRLAYYDQVSCAARIVGRLTAALDRSAVAGNYIMIVHGDHGSRITGADPLAGRHPIEQADMLASFSTLFAIKLPRQAGGIDNNLVPASQLLRSLALDEFKQFPVTSSTHSPSVILDNRNWRPTEKRALSADW